MGIDRAILSISLFAAVGCASSFKASDCVAAWNEDGPHAVIAAEGFTVAEIGVGEDKAGQTGCGAIFHSAPRRSWRFYGGVVEGGTVLRWDTQAGSSWTVDSPEGPTDATVRVRPGGTLVEIWHGANAHISSTFMP